MGMRAKQLIKDLAHWSGYSLFEEGDSIILKPTVYDDGYIDTTENPIVLMECHECEKVFNIRKFSAIDQYSNNKCSILLFTNNKIIPSIYRD
jgi:hypothetical protein